MKNKLPIHILLNIIIVSFVSISVFVFILWLFFSFFDVLTTFLMGLFLLGTVIIPSCFVVQGLWDNYKYEKERKDWDYEMFK